jgi:hypothetical protein
MPTLCRVVEIRSVTQNTQDLGSIPDVPKLKGKLLTMQACDVDMLTQSRYLEQDKLRRWVVIGDDIPGEAGRVACGTGSHVRMRQCRRVCQRQPGRHRHGERPDRPCCCSLLLVRAIRRTLLGGWGQTSVAHFYGEGFKRIGSSRSWPDNIKVVKVSNDLSCRMCRGHALEESLESECEQEGGERVPLLHTAGEED